jgi:hypothetical protein
LTADLEKLLKIKEKDFNPPKAAPAKVAAGL